MIGAAADFDPLGFFATLSVAAWVLLLAGVTILAERKTDPHNRNPHGETIAFVLALFGIFLIVADIAYLFA